MIIQRIRKQLENQKGFTLMELMIVIAIIGVLAAIAVPQFTKATDSAKLAQAQANVRTIDGAIASYYAANGKYPDKLDDLLADYLKAVPKNYNGTPATYTKATGEVEIEYTAGKVVSSSKMDPHDKAAGG